LEFCKKNQNSILWLGIELWRFGLSGLLISKYYFVDNECFTLSFSNASYLSMLRTNEFSAIFIYKKENFNGSC
jgi:hypothetical protein